MNNNELKRSINLPTAIFIIIGYVVGATIFILPGELSSIAGPAVFLAYLLAAIPAIFYCFVIAQLGSAVPVSGGAYVLIKKVLSPFAGFIYLWVVVSLAVVAVPLIALGFAQYLSTIIVGADIKLIALLTIVALTIFNYLGMAVAGVAQNIMVVLFIAVLLMFSGGGLVFSDNTLLHPLLPFGYQSLFVAAATAYFSYAGVLVVAEIAGEIKNPGRNIPLAIAISFSIIILLYTVVPLVLVQMIPWVELSKSNTPVVAAAKKYFPPFFVTIILVGALLAAATSINSILMGLSRDVFKGAVDGILPKVFSRINLSKETPSAAIIVVGCLSIIGVFFGGSIGQYAQVAVVSLMLTQILTSMAVLRMPMKSPELHERSSFKLGPKSLFFFSVGSIVISFMFLVLLVLQNPLVSVIGFLYLAVGGGYYVIQNNTFNKIETS